MENSFILRKQPFDGCFFDLVKPLLVSPDAVLLDSCDGFGGLGRYSFLGLEPFAKLSADVTRASLTVDGTIQTTGHDPFAVLKSLMKDYALDFPEPAIPFAGGAMGYFSYDLGRRLEKLPDIAIRRDHFPEMLLGFYDQVIVYDSRDHIIHLCVTDPLKKGGAWMNARMERLEQTLKTPPETTVGSGPARNIHSNFTRDRYLQAVEKILEYIRQGDIYQANLSQAFEFEIGGSPLQIYERLRNCSPAPFSAFLNMGEKAVLSSSPERFLRLTDGVIETRPIKGTRPRGRTPAEDQAFARELSISEKDRAELLMIVDLERNDIGRVARFGSVRVEEMAVLETYANVHHLAATIRADLNPGYDAVDLIRASFPGGSITGAPKIRAMEIIEELEPSRRSLYTGSLGYIGYNGAMDLNILIRTMMIDGNRGSFQVGGGIVADSDPLKEYEETLHKAEGLLCALGLKKEAVYG